MYSIFKMLRFYASVFATFVLFCLIVCYLETGYLLNLLGRIFIIGCLMWWFTTVASKAKVVSPDVARTIVFVLKICAIMISFEVLYRILKETAVYGWNKLQTGDIPLDTVN